VVVAAGQRPINAGPPAPARRSTAAGPNFLVAGAAAVGGAPAADHHLPPLFFTILI
ncbi:hypothetical protein A2U01_0111715, partial [Trifolium medium]|nr:hypothetical protein [Trifolium medium]